MTTMTTTTVTNMMEPKVKKSSIPMMTAEHMIVSRRMRGRMGTHSVSEAGTITSYSLSRMMNGMNSRNNVEHP